MELYQRFSLSLRLVEDLPAASGIIVPHETNRLCGVYDAIVISLFMPTRCLNHQRRVLFSFFKVPPR